MNPEESYRLAQKIRKKCDGSRDPDRIAHTLGIEVYEFDLGNLKGMYSSASRHRTIYLNKKLTGYLRRFVLMHEICHDQIPEHRRSARNRAYHDLLFFGGKDTSERDANAVAAHILIDQEEMVSEMQEGKSVQEIARSLYVPEDLLLIEIEDYTKIHPELAAVRDALPRCGEGGYLKDYTDGTF